MGTGSTPVGAKVRLRTAHVLGGGVAGLLAARVLSDHAEQVVVVEPDRRESLLSGAVRSGAPQGSQVHLLLPGGRRQVERFFPGFVEEAVAAGAVLCEARRTVAYLDDAEQLPTPNAEFLASSRPLLESLLWRRVLALPGLSLVHGRVTSLGFAHEAVNAVHLARDGHRTEMASDFVVDATGRASRIPDWLHRGGWPRPETDRLAADVRYFSARFSRSSTWDGPLCGIARYTPGFPTDIAGAAVNAVEAGQWAVMLARYGAGGDGLTADALTARCRELPPVFAEAVRGELIGEVVPHRHPHSRWRRFDALERLPARLAVVGDAVASFNPVYGQGMSSAALHASCLSEFLRSDTDLDAAARSFFDLQGVVTEAAWRTSTAADAVRLGVAGSARTEAEQRQARAMRLVHRAAAQDVEIATAVRAVGFMTAHPATLLSPELVARAANGNGVEDR
ncbi:hypothetical protein ADL03_36075 [Nocardia sp. NRRL S-836]|nr:hypothetical protein ADL03_36075 [Nocardia sp. NRRL S-836]